MDIFRSLWTLSAHKDIIRRHRTYYVTGPSSTGPHGKTIRWMRQLDYFLTPLKHLVDLNPRVACTGLNCQGYTYRDIVHISFPQTRGSPIPWLLLSTYNSFLKRFSTTFLVTPCLLLSTPHLLIPRRCGATAFSQSLDALSHPAAVL